MAAVGGLMARPKFMFVPLLVVGLLYCAPFVIGAVYPTSKQLQYPDIYPDASYAASLSWSLPFLLPGLAIVAEAFYIVLAGRGQRAGDQP